MDVDNPFPWQRIRYRVGIEGRISGIIGCEADCTCSGGPRTWQINGSVDAEFDVMVPVPGLNHCRKLLHSALKLACYAIKYKDILNSGAQAVRTARRMGMARLSAIASAVAVANDPNLWCNAMRGDRNVRFQF